MVEYILRRLLHAVFVLVSVSIIIFLLIRLAPGNPIEMILGDNATPEQIAIIEAKYGLDKSLPHQYLIWIKNILSGDFGESIYYHASNWSLIVGRLPATFELAASALLLSLIVSLPIGLVAGIKKGSVIDVMAMLFALLGQALSPVWIGLVLILIVCVSWGALPAFG